MKLLVVDDETYARKRIIRLLNNSLETYEIYEAENADEALTFLNEIKPDLMFLDINMPRTTGIEFLKSLEKKPYTIFVTAHSEHAVDAFDLDAIDFLLKPFNEERFFKSLEKAKQFLSFGGSRKIILKDGSKTYSILLDEIEYIQSDGNYIRIFSSETELHIRYTLTGIFQKLNSTHFCKINRSTIVNKHFINEVKNIDHGDKSIILRSGKHLKASRSHNFKF